MNTPTIIRLRLISQPCATCNSRAGMPCTSKSIEGQAVDWVHAA